MEQLHEERREKHGFQKIHARVFGLSERGRAVTMGHGFRI